MNKNKFVVQKELANEIVTFAIAQKINFTLKVFGNLFSISIEGKLKEKESMSFDLRQQITMLR